MRTRSGLVTPDILTYLEQRKEKLSKLKTGALRHFGLISVYFSTPKTLNL